MIDISTLKNKIEDNGTTSAGRLQASEWNRLVGAVEELQDESYVKPTSGIPTTDLADGVIPDVSRFITASVDDLVNYYLKSETYTKAQVDALIAAVSQFSYEVVSSLPTASASTMHKIYLVPSAEPKTQNVKDEYITVRSGSAESYTYAWEQIGSTAIDLSGYVTTTQLSIALSAYTTTTSLTTLLAAKQDILVSGTNLKTINQNSLLGSGDITIESGEDGVGFDSISTPTTVDGTVVITLSNEDTITLDLNHDHLAYPKYQLCEDEAEYTAITNKDSRTLYLIPE